MQISIFMKIILTLKSWLYKELKNINYIILFEITIRLIIVIFIMYMYFYNIFSNMFFGIHCKTEH